MNSFLILQADPLSWIFESNLFTAAFQGLAMLLIGGFIVYKVLVMLGWW